MALLNLLKAEYTGKLGQTVGAKWKDKSTVRTLSKPTYTDTPEQQVIRSGFGELTAFLSLFTGELRTLTAIDTKSMTLRNALIKLNKAQVIAGSLDPATIQISKGGLLLPGSRSISISATTGNISASWTPAVGANITTKAKVIVVAVDKLKKLAFVKSALNSAGALSIPGIGATTSAYDTYMYLLDYRGSSKVGSPSAYSAVTPA